MKRALCTWFPSLASDLARLRILRAAAEPDTRGQRTDGDRRPTPTPPPVIIASTRGPRRTVACRCDRAGALGVRTGMPLAEASALAPGALVRPLNPERNLAALHRLALLALRFSPTVALAPPDALLLNIHGCQHIFKGERNLLGTLRRFFARRGLHTRAAIAPTYACARALARFGPETAAIIEAGGERAAIDPLPIDALDLEADALSGLLEVGIERIADVLCVPRAALPARFGSHALLAADLMLGRAPELVRPVREIEPVKAAVTFDGPTTQWEALALACQAVLADLCAALLAAEAGTLRLDLTLPRSDMPPLRLTLSLSLPTRDARRLWTLLRPRLERADLGFGIEGIGIVAATVCGMAHTQRTLHADDPTRADSGRPGGEQLAALIDSLRNRLGHDRVRSAVLTRSHLPERAFDFTAADLPPEPAHAPPTRHHPTCCLESPLPARAAVDARGLPVCLHVNASDFPVVHAAGPHRFAPEWWAADPGRPRDYFAVLLADGRRLWLRHDTDTGRWWVQGAWS